MIISKVFFFSSIYYFAWKRRLVEEVDVRLYHVAIDSGADPQLVAFVLHILDEVDEHVRLRQVLWGEQNHFESPLQTFQ